MARNRRTTTKALTGEQAQGVLLSLIIYLEALEGLLQKSETLPASTKATATVTLGEIDYLLGVYTEQEFQYPHK